MEMEVQERNPYQAPNSHVERAPSLRPPTPPTVDSEELFFAPPPIKLMVMSSVTLGFYQVYWFYRNWKSLRYRDGDNMMPFWRAFFASIWAYSCFRRMKEATESRRNIAAVSAGAIAITYFLLNLSARLPGNWWVLTFFSFVPLLPFNSLARNYNQLNGQRSSDCDSFGALNWLGIVIGGVLLLLIVVGLMMPSQRYR